jgi:hypothetical protein
MEGKLGRHHGGVERQETAQQCASRLLTEELKRRKKNDQAKAGIARRLRRQTTVTWDWIARGLAMGAGGYAANWVRSFLNS